MSGNLKKRGQSKKGAVEKSRDFVDDDLNKQQAEESLQKDPDSKYVLALTAVTVLAGIVRFSGISIPSKVVFDEVHFGKFASYYLERTYFFDLHPPFAKLLIAFAGWIMGYDGKFKFDNINDDYIVNNVPYVGYRALSAIQGTVTVPLMFLTMKALNFSSSACFLSGMIVAFDNAHVIDSRLILLDATLNLSVALTMFCYAKYSTYRKTPFSKGWWAWLYLTGFSLSCVISTKYVGVLTYVSIGVAVLNELWFWLDYKRGLSLEDFAKHFLARLWALIIVPFTIYLFWFYLHFSILTKSGPGDSFMSSEFQESLLESSLAKVSKTVNYYDVVTIKHKDTDAFLHSHEHVYPLRYEDGRVSSNTQQVTCVFGQEESDVLNDVNNQWQVLPVDLNVEKNTAVYTNDMFRLKHIGTGGYLLTHDVASPLKSTNEEFTVHFGEETDSKKYNQTIFRLRLAGTGSSSKTNKRKLVQTKATPMRILHVDTIVAMWTHNDQLLPEWAFGQQEVSGNKKVQDADNVWTFDTIVNLDPHDPRAEYKPKKIRKIAFLKKWWELQGLMFYHNNQLSSEHPFASQPDSWPLSLAGVSFWNDNENKKQIYFIGNFVGFWAEVCFLAIYLGLLMADQVSRRRNVHLLHDRARSRLYNTLSFFFIAWCAHYLPFFLMNRQKFLHHYLPAHLIAALFSGGLLEFLCSNNRVGSKNIGVVKSRINILTGLLSIGLIGCFFFFRPISYGDVSLAPEEVQKRQWLDMKLHYAK